MITIEGGKVTIKSPADLKDILFKDCHVKFLCAPGVIKGGCFENYYKKYVSPEVVKEETMPPQSLTRDKGR